ncbi:MAG: hypothetical protein IIV90_04070 [Oscillospiraceae bacterium]|nr:hypothetical protein [Oscillospiraceae bacterium]
MSEKNTWQKFADWVNGDAAPQARFEKEYQPAPSRRETRKLRKASDGKAHSHEVLLYRISAILAAVVLLSILLATVVHLPLHGTPGTPDQNEVAQRYIEQGLEETGAVNLVAGMILDYRAFDTFGESCVLFLTAMCAFVLLWNDKHALTPKLKAEREEDEVILREEESHMQRHAAHLLAPFVFLFGIYVILNGHLSPGGGFSGGLILGSGLILYAAGCGQDKVHRFFNYKTFTAVNFACLSVYACAKAYSFLMGANHLETHIPKGIPGAILSAGLILPLNICVGFVVACTMYAFYALFNKGDL